MCEEMTTNLAKEGISFQLMSPPLSDIDNLDDLISLWHWLLTKNKLSKYEETLLLLLEKNKGVLGLSIDQ